jgi:hypothetical protein
MNGRADDRALLFLSLVNPNPILGPGDLAVKEGTSGLVKPGLLAEDD